MRPAAARWVLLVAVLLLACGCNLKKGQELSAGEWLTGPGGPKMVAMATDTEDPDRRREGIVLLTGKEWGLHEPYLGWYANRLEVDRDPTVRCVAARALGKAAAVKYLPVLVKALVDSSAVVRCDAAVAMEQVRGEAAIDPLRKTAAEDASLDVRCAAIRALRYYPQQKVAGTLVYCLSDDAFEVRHWAHEALVGMVGKDLGVEPGDWSSIARPDVPLRAPQWRRPWWDWFGVSRPDESRAAASTQPVPPPKPWWDWMGLVRRSAPVSGTSQPVPASSPSSAPAK
jgi:hypothetical protein